MPDYRVVRSHPGTPCRHYWIIESGDGPRRAWRGRCKLCKAVREWPIEPGYKDVPPGLMAYVWRERRAADELVMEASA